MARMLISFCACCLMSVRHSFTSFFTSLERLRIVVAPAGVGIVADLCPCNAPWVLAGIQISDSLLLMTTWLLMASEGSAREIMLMPTMVRPRNLELYLVVLLTPPSGIENRIFVLPLQMVNRLECASSLRRGQSYFNYKLLHHFTFVISRYL